MMDKTTGLHVYHGQKLNAEDFQLEQIHQDYTRQKRSAGIMSSGVVKGLNLRSANRGRQNLTLEIEKGIALTKTTDGGLEQVILPEDRSLELDRLDFSPPRGVDSLEVRITISADITLSGKARERGEELTRIQHQPLIQIRGSHEVYDEETEITLASALLALNTLGEPTALLALEERKADYSPLLPDELEDLELWLTPDSGIKLEADEVTEWTSRKNDLLLKRNPDESATGGMSLTPMSIQSYDSLNFSGEAGLSYETAYGERTPKIRELFIVLKADTKKNPTEFVFSAGTLETETPYILKHDLAAEGRYLLGPGDMSEKAQMTVNDLETHTIPGNNWHIVQIRLSREERLNQFQLGGGWSGAVAEIIVSANNSERKRNGTLDYLRHKYGIMPARSKSGFQVETLRTEELVLKSKNSPDKHMRFPLPTLRSSQVTPGALELEADRIEFSGAAERNTEVHHQGEIQVSDDLDMSAGKLQVNTLEYPDGSKQIARNYKHHQVMYAQTLTSSGNGQADQLLLKGLIKSESSLLLKGEFTFTDSIALEDVSNFRIYGDESTVLKMQTNRNAAFALGNNCVNIEFHNLTLEANCGLVSVTGEAEADNGKPATKAATGIKGVKIINCKSGLSSPGRLFTAGKGSESECIEIRGVNWSMTGESGEDTSIIDLRECSVKDFLCKGNRLEISGEGDYRVVNLHAAVYVEDFEISENDMTTSYHGCYIQRAGGDRAIVLKKNRITVVKVYDPLVLDLNVGIWVEGLPDTRGKNVDVSENLVDIRGLEDGTFGFVFYNISSGSIRDNIIRQGDGDAAIKITDSENILVAKNIVKGKGIFKESNLNIVDDNNQVNDDVPPSPV